MPRRGLSLRDSSSWSNCANESFFFLLNVWVPSMPPISLAPKGKVQCLDHLWAYAEGLDEERLVNNLGSCIPFTALNERVNVRAARL